LTDEHCNVTTYWPGQFQIKRRFGRAILPHALPHEDKILNPRRCRNCPFRNDFCGTATRCSQMRHRHNTCSILDIERRVNLICSLLRRGNRMAGGAKWRRRIPLPVEWFGVGERCDAVRADFETVLRSKERGKMLKRTNANASDANAALACKFWLARCFHDGSPEEDLFRAVCANSIKPNMVKPELQSHQSGSRRSTETESSGTVRIED